MHRQGIPALPTARMHAEMNSTGTGAGQILSEIVRSIIIKRLISGFPPFTRNHGNLFAPLLIITALYYKEYHVSSKENK